MVTVYPHQISSHGWYNITAFPSYYLPGMLVGARFIVSGKKAKEGASNKKTAHQNLLH
jgi:hypothetical protein